ncbi:MAG: urease accessory UreF family protein [Pseudomonadota bacterium]
MPIDTHLITLTQWLSPSFPVGAFAYSHGLEAAVADGWVADGAGLQCWLGDVLVAGSGRCDAILLRLAAENEGQDLVALNAEALAYAPAQERRLEAERQGAAFARTVRAVWEIDLPDLVLPVAVGAACGRQGIDVEMALPLYLHAMVSNLVAAGQRLMPLGQTEAQGVLAALQGEIEAVTEAARGAASEDMESHAFLSDIAAMRHEGLEPRVFQS